MTRDICLQTSGRSKKRGNKVELVRFDHWGARNFCCPFAFFLFFFGSLSLVLLPLFFS